MSDAIRQIRARARRKAAGLVRLEFWVPATRRDEVRAAVASVLADEQADEVASMAEVPDATTGGADNVPVVQRRQRLMTDIDGLLD
jgi:vacuolar-type H+-ATPase subunit I/STV1